MEEEGYVKRKNQQGYTNDQNSDALSSKNSFGITKHTGNCLLE